MKSHEGPKIDSIIFTSYNITAKITLHLRMKIISILNYLKYFQSHNYENKLNFYFKINPCSQRDGAQRSIFCVFLRRALRYKWGQIWEKCFQSLIEKCVIGKERTLILNSNWLEMEFLYFLLRRDTTFGVTKIKSHAKGNAAGMCMRKRNARHCRFEHFCAYKIKSEEPCYIETKAINTRYQRKISRCDTDRI